MSPTPSLPKICVFIVQHNPKKGFLLTKVFLYWHDARLQCLLNPRKLGKKLQKCKLSSYFILLLNFYIYGKMINSLTT